MRCLAGGRLVASAMDVLSKPRALHKRRQQSDLQYNVLIALTT